MKYIIFRWKVDDKYAERCRDWLIKNIVDSFDSRLPYVHEFKHSIVDVVVEE